MKPALILGTAQFNPRYGVRRMDSIGSRGCEFLSKAFRLGFGALDTAPGYAQAQETIGRCGWPGQIHSKVSAGEEPVASLTATLAELGRDRIDIAYFHDDRILEREASFFAATAQAVVPRLASRMGVSVYSPEDFDRALEIHAIGAIQVPMNVVDQRITQQHLEKAKDTGKLVFARSIFLQGALVPSADNLPAQISQLADVNNAITSLSKLYSRPVIEILIGMVRDRPHLDGLVMGAESTPQLRQIADAFDSPPLPDALLERLKSLRIDDPSIIDPRTWPKIS